MLKIENFTLAYNGPALENVNLSFKSGEITVLAGTSGSRKSSPLKVINGAIPYFQPAELSDEVTYQNRSLLGLDMSERSNIMATVFQNPKTQFYAVDSTNEMAFALENRHLPPKIVFQRIDQFTQLLEMRDLLNRDVFALSGDEKRFSTITSVAYTDNNIYLLDKPSSPLDRLTEKLLYALKESWLD